MESHTGLCFPTFLSDRSGFKKRDNRYGNFDLNNIDVAGNVLVSATPSNSTEKLSCSTNLLIGPN